MAHGVGVEFQRAFGQRLHQVDAAARESISARVKT
jgi:hypothetical protein